MVFLLEKLKNLFKNKHCTEMYGAFFMLKKGVWYMAGKAKIGAGIALDGEKEFKSAISGIN